MHFRARLSTLLFEHLKKELPSLKKELNTIAKKTKKELNLIGDKHSSVEERKCDGLAVPGPIWSDLVTRSRARLGVPSAFSTLCLLR